MSKAGEVLIIGSAIIFIFAPKQNIWIWLFTILCQIVGWTKVTIGAIEIEI